MEYIEYDPNKDQTTGDPNLGISEASALQETVMETVNVPVPVETNNNVSETVPAAADTVNNTVSVSETCISFSAPVYRVKNYLSMFNSITNEIKLIFNQRGITICHVDPAHVCMMKIVIPIRSLDEYKLISMDPSNTAPELTVSIDLETFLKKLKGSDKTDRVLFHYSTVNETVFELTIGSFKHEINTITGVPDGPKLPVFELKSLFEVPVKTFYNFLIQARTVSDHMMIKTDPDGLYLSAAGDTNKVNLNMSARGDLPYLICDKEYSSLYAIDYLVDVFKVIKNIFKENIRMETNTDHPIRITGDGEIELLVLLAPRIEDRDQAPEETQTTDNNGDAPQETEQ